MRLRSKKEGAKHVQIDGTFRVACKTFLRCAMSRKLIYSKLWTARWWKDPQRRYSQRPHRRDSPSDEPKTSKSLHCHCLVPAGSYVHFLAFPRSVRGTRSSGRSPCLEDGTKSSAQASSCCSLVLLQPKVKLAAGVQVWAALRFPITHLLLIVPDALGSSLSSLSAIQAVRPRWTYVA